jgi:hypothetical protein
LKKGTKIKTTTTTTTTTTTKQRCPAMVYVYPVVSKSGKVT